MKRREIRIKRPPDYACELDALLLVAFSSKRVGGVVFFETTWAD